MNEKDSKIQLGNITFNKNILMSIISLATTEINGVVRISKRAKFPFIKSTEFDGIKINFENEEMIVDVYIDVYSNHNAPDLCFRVQENIRNNIFSMVNIKPSKVNIHIVDVIIEKDDKLWERMRE